MLSATSLELFRWPIFPSTFKKVRTTVGRPSFPADWVKHRIKRQDQQLAALAKADAEAALGEES